MICRFAQISNLTPDKVSIDYPNELQHYKNDFGAMISCSTRINLMLPFWYKTDTQEVGTTIHHHGHGLSGRCGREAEDSLCHIKLDLIL